MPTPLQGTRVLVPIEVSGAMLKTGTTLSEPDTASGEVAWSAGGTYAVGNSRTYNGVVYECVRAIDTPRATPPSDDGQYWAPMGPTMMMAPFDDYGSTTASAESELRYVIQPGVMFTGAQAYNLAGDTYQIDVYDSMDPGRTLLKSKSGSLFEQAAGFWELMFAPLPRLNRITIEDFPMAPDAVLDLRVNAASAARVKIGDIKIGDWRFLAVSPKWGHPDYGAAAERKSNAYKKDNKDGTFSLVRRPTYREVKLTVAIPPADAPYTDALLEEITDVVVPVEAVNLPQYDFLNTIGFVSGSMAADNYGEVILNLTVKGVI